MTTEYLNVTGRLVQGDAYTPQTTDFYGKPMTTMDGSPKVQYFIGVAVPKTDAGFQAVMTALQAEANAGFPGGEASRSDFAWKMVDGDDPQNASKIGFQGCWVFRFTSGFAWQVVKSHESGQVLPITDVKRGDYVRVFFQAVANKNTRKPGLYLNAAVVESVGYGEPIVSGPNASDILGGAGTAVLPTGASATPIGGQAAPAMPGQAAPAMPGQAAPAMPGQAAPAMPGQAAPAMPGQAAPAMPGQAAPAMPGQAAPAMPGQAAIQPNPGVMAGGE